MKLGLLGGTFDPIHLGHLRAAETAREALGLDELRFVPAGIPPHRQGPLSPAHDRYAMVALATASHPAFVASDAELTRNGPSYTVDTVARLRGEHPQAELVLVVGSDTWPELAGWRDAERLLTLCSLAVVTRPGISPAAPGPAARLVEGPGLPISASEIRSRVREGHSIRYLVPDAVAAHIRKRGLYR